MQTQISACCRSRAHYKAVCACAIASALSAACATEEVTRECDAFENTLVADWETVEGVGQAQTFVDAGGTSVVLVQVSRMDSTSFSVTETVAEDEDVGCTSISERVYDVNDGTVNLIVQFNQLEAFEDQPLDEQILNVIVQPQVPTGELLDYDFTLRLSNPVELYGDEFVASVDPAIVKRTAQNVDLDGSVQTLIVEQEYTDPSFIAGLSPNIDSAFTRLTLSEGEGIIAFELADGTVFARSDLAGAL